MGSNLNSKAVRVPFCRVEKGSSKTKVLAQKLKKGGF